MGKIEELLKRNGIKEKPKKQLKTLEITAEDFALLDAEDEDTIYYIIAEDGSVRIKKGENR